MFATPSQTRKLPQTATGLLNRWKRGKPEIGLDTKTSRRLICTCEMQIANRPGEVRDAIFAHFRQHHEATVAEIRKSVSATLGREVPASSIRSYLNINVGSVFMRVERGRYRLTTRQ